MNIPLVYRWLVVGAALFVLPGCTSKTDKAKIKELTEKVATLEEEHSKELDELAQQNDKQMEEANTALSAATEKAQEMTVARDQAVSELTDLKAQVEREEAVRQAAMPKKPSDPGHPEFNPASDGKYSNALATITGDKTNSCGFVVETGGKFYLYALPQALTANKTLSITNVEGTKFTKFGNLETAAGVEFVRLELLEAGSVPALHIADENFTLDSGTVVASLWVGISGTASSVRGTVFNLANETVDTEPAVLQDKLGGALMEAASGKVLAIIVGPAADHRDLWPDPNATPDQTCRALRLNRAITWQPVAIATFIAEARKIAEFDRNTRVGAAMAILAPTSAGLGLEAMVTNSLTARSILADAKDLPPVADALAMHEQMKTKKLRLNDEDALRRYAGLATSTLGVLERTAVGFEPAKFCAYHRPAIENSMKWRKDTEGKLSTAASRSGE